MNSFHSMGGTLYTSQSNIDTYLILGLIMNKLLPHLNIVLKHKYYVLIECFKHKLYYQGIMHDLSKFTRTEFIQSARYCNGVSTPIGRIKEELGYSEAWLHHKGHNKHHWEYWCDWYYGELKPCDIPEKYLVEICCDMIAASKAYNKSNFNKRMPYKYLVDNKSNWVINEQNLNFIETFLENYSMDM